MVSGGRHSLADAEIFTLSKMRVTDEDLIFLPRTFVAAAA